MGKLQSPPTRNGFITKQIIAFDNKYAADHAPPGGHRRFDMQIGTDIFVDFPAYTIAMARGDARHCMSCLGLKDSDLEPVRFFALEPRIVVLCLVGYFTNAQIKSIRSKMKEYDYICEEKHSDWEIGSDNMVRERGFKGVTPTPTPEPASGEVAKEEGLARPDTSNVLPPKVRPAKAGGRKAKKGKKQAAVHVVDSNEATMVAPAGGKKKRKRAASVAEELDGVSVGGDSSELLQGAAKKKAKVVVDVAAGKGLSKMKMKETKKKEKEISTINDAVFDTSSATLNGSQFDGADIDIMLAAGIPCDDVTSNTTSMTRVPSTDLMLLEAATPTTKTNVRSATLKRKRAVDEGATRQPKKQELPKKAKKGEEIAVDVDVDDKVIDATFSDTEVNPAPAPKKARTTRGTSPQKNWQTMASFRALRNVAKVQGLHGMKRMRMVIDVRQARFKDPLPRNPTMGLDRINAKGFSKRSHKLFQLATFAVWRGDMEVARYWIGEFDESIPHIRHSPSVHLTDEESMMPYLTPDDYVAPDFPPYEFYPYPFDAACLPSNRVV